MYILVLLAMRYTVSLSTCFTPDAFLDGAVWWNSKKVESGDVTEKENDVVVELKRSVPFAKRSSEEERPADLKSVGMVGGGSTGPVGGQCPATWTASSGKTRKRFMV